MWINTRAFRFTGWFITFWLVGSLFASPAWAQTPDAVEPTPTEVPVVMETPEPTATTVPTAPVEPTPTPEPEPTLAPVDPTATEAPAEPTATEVPAATEAPEPTSTESPAEPTEEPVEPTAEPTAETPEPTPTAVPEVPEVPDTLELVGSAGIAINPGEQHDIVIRYTLGSDRSNTELLVNLTATGGESLEGWSLNAVGRSDLHTDVNDPTHNLIARVEVAEATEIGQYFDTTWRITAPDHIEVPVAVHVRASGVIVGGNGDDAGAVQDNLASIQATPSEHLPTLTCDPASVEAESNVWNCAFDTSHPGDDVSVLASGDNPAGWKLTLNDNLVETEPLVLSNDTIAQSSFVLTAAYPLGCPNGAGNTTATFNLSISYPSGEAVDLTAELPLQFDKPESMVSISSFGFDDVDLRDANSTSGQLTIVYQETPCAWEATVQLTDLESEGFIIPNDALRIDSVEGLPSGTITLDQGVITIRSAESEVAVPAGELTIHFTIDMPAQIQPGAYRIGINIQFLWMSD